MNKGVVIKKEVICGYFLFYLPNFLKRKRCYVGWLVKYVGPIFFLLRKTVQQEDRTLHVSGNHGHPAPGCIAARTGKELPPGSNRRSSFHHYLFLKNPGGKG